MKTVTKFITDDGKEFDTPEEAELWEIFVWAFDDPNNEKDWIRFQNAAKKIEAMTKRKYSIND
jgi:hypothetical protein